MNTITRRRFFATLAASVMATTVVLPIHFLRERKVWNVRAFWRSGDTDWSPAFQRAVDAAGREERAGTVFVPAGAYRVTSTLSLPENVRLKGERINETVLV